MNTINAALTVDERKARMAEIRPIVDQKVADYNDATMDADFEKIAHLNDEIVALVNEFTYHAKNVCLAECANSDDPMMEAVKRMEYETIRIKDTKEGELKIPNREIVSTTKQIDLLELHKYCANGIGADKKWLYVLEQLALRLTMREAERLGLDPKEVNDSYAMNKLSREVDLGKNPVSDKNILATLDKAVHAMIGEDHSAIKKDVNFMIDGFSSKDKKALRIKCANQRAMCGLMLELCHRIVTEESYGMRYPQTKN